MLGLPPVKSAAAVNVAVRVKPEPLMALNVPLATVTSPVFPSHKKVLPGSSVNVNVTVAVSPAFSAALSLVIFRVGASVSVEVAALPPPLEDPPARPAITARTASRPAADKGRLGAEAAALSAGLPGISANPESDACANLDVDVDVDIDVDVDAS